MKYTPVQVAKILGISVRTLHYYDSIRLLVPEKDSHQYRYYTDEHIALLHIIVMMKKMTVKLLQSHSLI